MPDVLAIVSKAIFERDARVGGKVAGVGDVVPMDRYVSKNKGLSPVAEGGALFLVTVRPPDESLWLVAILEAPKFDGEQWVSAPNTAAIADIGALKSQITFANGSGISAKKGALGMSLQTPRVLSDADVALLRAAAGAGPALPVASAKGHLNAHEEGGSVPCLCRRCVGAAPESITVGGLDLVRDRAEAKGRFLWYWYPRSLEAQRDLVRRAVEGRMHARVKERARREYDDLDATLGEAGEGDE
jgi:hypothetical protein